jgi:hypothetical protein
MITLPDARLQRKILRERGAHCYLGKRRREGDWRNLQRNFGSLRLSRSAA